MRLAVVIDSLGLGGAERLVVTLARHAPGAGVHPVVFTLRPPLSPLPSEALRSLDVPVVEVPTTWHHQLADPWRLRRLRRSLEAAEVDVVHTHLGASNLLGVLAARRAGLPVVATLHNVWLGERRLRDRLERAGLARADAVVAVGHEVARTHLPRLRRPLEVVPNPVDLAATRPTGDVAALRRGLLDGHPGPLLLCVGRLEPQKGHDVLLEAHRRVVVEHPGAVLALAGEGRLGDDLVRQGGLGTADRLRHLGARSDVADLMAAADLFVSASRYEGLPLAVLEAMAARLPVVATAVGDVPLLLRDCGETVPPEDPVRLAEAISSLLGDDGRRRQLAERARRRVEDQGPDRWVATLRSLYERVLAGRRRATGAGAAPVVLP